MTYIELWLYFWGALHVMARNYGMGGSHFASISMGVLWPITLPAAFVYVILGGKTDG